MATGLMAGIQSLEQFGRASPKEHPCQVSSRLAQWFTRRCLKKLWTMDIGRLQKLTMSTSRSGELKMYELLCSFSWEKTTITTTTKTSLSRKREKKREKKQQCQLT